jgi:hypothetical protein
MRGMLSADVSDSAPPVGGRRRSGRSVRGVNTASASIGQSGCAAAGGRRRNRACWWRTGDDAGRDRLLRFQFGTSPTLAIGASNEWLPTEFDMTNDVTRIAQPDHTQGSPVVLMVSNYDAFGAALLTRVRSMQFPIFQRAGDQDMRATTPRKAFTPIQRVCARTRATPRRQTTIARIEIFLWSLQRAACADLHFSAFQRAMSFAVSSGTPFIGSRAISAVMAWNRAMSPAASAASRSAIIVRRVCCSLFMGLMLSHNSEPVKWVAC